MKGELGLKSVQKETVIEFEEKKSKFIDTLNQFQQWLKQKNLSIQ